MVTRGRRRATWAGVGAVVALLVVALPGVAGAGPEDLQQAQRRANQAAGDLARAIEELARTDDTVANLEARVARVETRVADVRGQVAQLAVRQYVGSTVRITRLLRMADANEVVRAQQFASVVAETSTEALEQYRAEKEDLRVEVTALEREQKVRESRIGELRRRQAEAVKELDRLAEIEAQAQAARAEERRRVEAAAAAQAAADASPQAPAAAPGGRSAPADTRAAEAATPAPATRAAAPAAPAPSPAGEWICPVQGPRSFSNDYGASRGGGASHQGNDILAPTGTPVVANVGGVVTQRTGAISGKAYFLAGDDGNRYFGAHLDSFGASGRVSAGTQIGTVGNTGDASGGPPHLHFEIHPGGSGYTNPYSTLVKYC